MSSDDNHEYLVIRNNNIYSLKTTKWGDLILKSKRCTPKLSRGHLSNRKIGIKKSISQYNHHFIFLDNNCILVYGNNTKGELGSYHKNNVEGLQVLMHDDNIKIIACGLEHSIIYKNDGSVLVAGEDMKQRLGLKLNDDYRNRYNHQLLMIDKDIIKIACGSHYTVMLKNNGDLLFFGLSYRVINNSYNYNYKPILLTNMKNIRQISCGSYHLALLNFDGEVVIYGDVEYKPQKTFCLDTLKPINPTNPFILAKHDSVYQISCDRDATFIIQYNGRIIKYYNNDQPIIQYIPDKACEYICRYYYTLILHSGRISVNYTKDNPIVSKTGNHGMSLNIHNITQWNGTKFDPKLWTIKNHKFYGENFKNLIFTFLLICKRIYSQTNIKVPKVIIFEIIKVCL
jgi:alpha-tubulin suppressor-like RCC1 family protein